MIKITERPVTIDDFLRGKGLVDKNGKGAKGNPFKGWRTVSKTINFSLIFGASALSFMGTLKKSGFTEVECDEYITLTNNTDELNQLIASESAKGSRGLSPLMCKYLICATNMRNAFFMRYKGLQQRIKRTHDFAYKHGYVLTHFGPARHLPELLYMKYAEDPKTGKMKCIGGDSRMHALLFNHLKNNACNSTIQTMEARIVFATWAHIYKYIKEWHLKSYIWNSTHDSFDACVHKDELELFPSLINACGSWRREPFKGIPMRFESELSDIKDENLDEQYYKHGVEVPNVPIEVALEHYNKKHGTSYVFHGCDF